MKRYVRQRKIRFGRLIVLLLLVLLPPAGFYLWPVISALSGSGTVKKGDLVQWSKESLPSDILLLLVGKEKEERADTVLLCHLRPAVPEVRLLSFPRDTKVLTLHNQRLVKDKLTHSFRYGSVQLLQATLENYLKLPIDAYVLLDLNIFKRLVDVIGGVEVLVEDHLNYVDKAGGLVINLKKGKQVLNGQQAEGFVRFRSDGQGDLGRIERQKLFMQAFQAKLNALKTLSTDSIMTVGRMPGFVLDVYRDLNTNLAAESFLQLILAMSHTGRENIKFFTLPGRGEYVLRADKKSRINYFIASEKEQLKAKEWLLDGYLPPEPKKTLAQAGSEIFEAPLHDED